MFFAEELRQAVVDGNCYLVERALACSKPYNLDLPDNKGYTLLMNAVLGGQAMQHLPTLKPKTSVAASVQKPKNPKLGG